jgi:hypothetical protein
MRRTYDFYPKVEKEIPKEDLLKRVKMFDKFKEYTIQFDSPEYRIEINPKDKYERNLLMLSIINKDAEGIIKYLKISKIFVSESDKFGINAIDYALEVYKENQEVLIHLLQKLFAKMCVEDYYISTSDKVHPTTYLFFYNDKLIVSILNIQSTMNFPQTGIGDIGFSQLVVSQLQLQGHLIEIPKILQDRAYAYAIVSLNNGNKGLPLKSIKIRIKGFPVSLDYI